MVQLNLFGEKSIDSELIKVQNGEYIFLPSFIDSSVANDYLQKLRNKIKWKQESMNIYGKKVEFPRLTAWYGNDDKSYSFSGITLAPNPWTAERFLKSKIE